MHQSGPGKFGESSVFGIETHHYDQYNQLCMVSRADTGNIVFTRNNMGEVVGKKTGALSNASCSYSNVPQMPLFTLDNHGDVFKRQNFGDGPDITQEIDPNGNLLNVNVGSNVVTSWNYNSLNLPISEALAVNGNVFSMSYEYNESAQVERYHYPNGDTVEYKHNGRGQQISVRRLADSSHPAFSYVKNVKYFANGVVKEFRYGNDIVHSKTLNSIYHIEDIKDESANTMINHLSYGYDNNDNISHIHDLRDGSFSLNSINYDGLDRLINISGGTSVGNTQLNYDGLGNITYYETKNSILDYNYDRTNNRNMLTSVSGSGSDSKSYSFAYDDRGNVTNNGSRTFNFNANGNMETSGSFSYLYDGRQRRVYQNDFNGNAYSMYSYDGMLRYLKTSSGGTNHIYLNDKSVARDGIERSENKRQHFKAFGESIEGATENVGYTGHKFDTALGLNYMQARYYDPVIGRFYSNDPVGAVSHLGTSNGIHGFNRYAYANNNPYRYIDPNGESSVAIWGTRAVGGVSLFVPIPGARVFGVALIATTLTSDTPQNSHNETAPALPEGLVGTQDDPRAGQSRGKRHNSGPLSADNGGTGNPDEDFETLTGGTGESNPDRAPGSSTGANGITIRPGKEGEGPRIDIPANGDKPPETLHYPEENN